VCADFGGIDSVEAGLKFEV